MLHPRFFCPYYYISLFLWDSKQERAFCKRLPCARIVIDDNRNNIGQHCVGKVAIVMPTTVTTGRISYACRAEWLPAPNGQMVGAGWNVVQTRAIEFARIAECSRHYEKGNLLYEGQRPVALLVCVTRSGAWHYFCEVFQLLFCRSLLLPQNPCTIQINALSLHRQSSPSLLTMLNRRQTESNVKLVWTLPRCEGGRDFLKLKWAGRFFYYLWLQKYRIASHIQKKAV